MKKFALAGALATLTIATAACGGGGDSALTDREYIRALEGLCTSVNGDLADLELPDEGDYDGLADFADDAIDIENDGLDELNDLKPPEDLEGDHDDFVATIEDTITATEDLKAGAEDEDDGAISDAYDDLQASSEERSAIAEDIGADDCVEDSGTDPDEPADTTVPEPDTTVPDETVPVTEAPTEPPTEPTVPPTQATVPPTVPPTQATVPATQPPVTEPPIEMTMPPETEPPITGTDIGTVDFDNFAVPGGYQWQNIDATSLQSIQETFGAAFTGQIEAIGGAAVADTTTGAGFAAFVFFWYEPDIVASGTGVAFADAVASGSASTADTYTPGGLPVTAYTSTDGSEGLILYGGSTAVVLIGDAGSQAVLQNFLDAFLAAQG